MSAPARPPEGGASSLGEVIAQRPEGSPVSAARSRRPRGFTLLECLVALAILAVALASALRAVGNAAQSSAAVKEHTLAGWVAQNRLAELRATGAWPPVGNNEGKATQAGRDYVWRERIEPTPNPLFRRVEIRVFDARGAAPLTELSGFVVRPLR